MRVGLDTIYEAVDVFNEGNDDIVYYSDENQAVGVFVDPREVIISASRLWQVAYQYQYGRIYRQMPLPVTHNEYESLH